VARSVLHSGYPAPLEALTYGTARLWYGQMAGDALEHRHGTLHFLGNSSTRLPTGVGSVEHCVSSCDVAIVAQLRRSA
jgi:hypothetical protein